MEKKREKIEKHSSTLRDSPSWVLVWRGIRGRVPRPQCDSKRFKNILCVARQMTRCNCSVWIWKPNTSQQRLKQQWIDSLAFVRWNTEECNAIWNSQRKYRSDVDIIMKYSCYIEIGYASWVWYTTLQKLLQKLLHNSRPHVGMYHDATFGKFRMHQTKNPYARTDESICEHFANHPGTC